MAEKPLELRKWNREVLEATRCEDVCSEYGDDMLGDLLMCMIGAYLWKVEGSGTPRERRRMEGFRAAVGFGKFRLRSVRTAVAEACSGGWCDSARAKHVLEALWFVETGQPFHCHGDAKGLWILLMMTNREAKTLADISFVPEREFRELTETGDYILAIKIMETLTGKIRNYGWYAQAGYRYPEAVRGMIGRFDISDHTVNRVFVPAYDGRIAEDFLVYRPWYTADYHGDVRYDRYLERYEVRWRGDPGELDEAEVAAWIGSSRVVFHYLGKDTAFEDEADWPKDLPF